MDSLSTRRWCARGSLALLTLAFVLLLAFAGRGGLWLVLLTVATVVVVVAAGFWFLVQRGSLRWLALAVAVGTPVAALILFAANGLLWVAVVAGALLIAGVAAARLALAPERSRWTLPVAPAPAPRRPFRIMNPRSGGGKVSRFHLKERA